MLAIVLSTIPFKLFVSNSIKSIFWIIFGNRILPCQPVIFLLLVYNTAVLFGVFLTISDCQVLIKNQEPTKTVPFSNPPAYTNNDAEVRYSY